MRVRGGEQRVWVVALALAASACRGQAQPTLDPAESQERLNVVSNPSIYLDTSEPIFDDEASDYEQLLGVTVLNKSGFPVHGLEGDIHWLDDDGQPIGSSRFSLAGSVPAHASSRFSVSDGTLTSGTLRGGALRVAITFTHVTVGD
jgi:hypothetical protein